MSGGDGQPLAKGTIRFISISPTPNIAAGAFIKAGEFSIESSRGLVPGEYQVWITGMGEEETIALAKRKPEEIIPVVEETIPPRYNFRSELRVRITDTSPQRFDLDLKLAPETAH